MPNFLFVLMAIDDSDTEEADERNFTENDSDVDDVDVDVDVED